MKEKCSKVARRTRRAQVFEFTVTVVDDTGEVSQLPSTASQPPEAWTANGVADLFLALSRYIAVPMPDALAEIRYSKSRGITLQIGGHGRSATVGPLPIAVKAAREFARRAEWFALLPAVDVIH